MADGVADVEAERVDEQQPDRPERDRAAEALLDPHRRLDDPREAQPTGQHQELEVEREAALSQQRQDVGDDPAVDQLDPDLGVLHVQVEQDLDQSLVAPRVEPAQRRVVHRGVRVALGADDDVGFLRAHHRDEVAEEFGRDVAVRVDEAEIPPSSHPQSRPQRGALADVGGEGDLAHDVLGEAVEGERAAVGGAVRDRDDLEGHARRAEDPHHVRDRCPEAIAGVVVGDDDGHVERRFGQHRGMGPWLSRARSAPTPHHHLTWTPATAGSAPAPRGISAGQATRLHLHGIRGERWSGARPAAMMPLTAAPSCCASTATDGDGDVHAQHLVARNRAVDVVGALLEGHGELRALGPARSAWSWRS